jgi:hypothetical protein
LIAHPDLVALNSKDVLHKQEECSEITQEFEDRIMNSLFAALRNPQKKLPDDVSLWLA